MFYGSLNLGRFLRHRLDVNVHVFNNVELTNWLNYAPKLDKLLLNWNYRLYQHHQLTPDWHGFCRPASGQKTFCGGVYNSQTLKQTLELTGSTNELLVTASEITGIDREYRYIVIGGKICGESMYVQHTDFQSGYDDCYRRSIVTECIKRLAITEPYTFDCVDMFGEFYALEVNSFSCADFYQADLGPVVAAMEGYFERD